MSGSILVLDEHISQFFTDEFIDDTDLSANEKSIVANAALKRKRDFATGRYCAKKALEKWGVTGVEILRDETKAPVWPEGFTGSISHAEHLCGAVIVKSDTVSAIGLDIEKIGGVKKEMWNMVCTPSEQALLNTVFAGEHDLYATLIFSIKESFYKLQSPITKQFLEFTDVELRWDGENFALKVIKSNYGSLIDTTQMHIQWAVHLGQVISLCYILS